jgi:hypothetical protein
VLDNNIRGLKDISELCFYVNSLVI